MEGFAQKLYLILDYQPPLCLKVSDHLDLLLNYLFPSNLTSQFLSFYCAE